MNTNMKKLSLDLHRYDTDEIAPPGQNLETHVPAGGLGGDSVDLELALYGIQLPLDDLAEVPIFPSLLDQNACDIRAYYAHRAHALRCLPIDHELLRGLSSALRDPGISRYGAGPRRPAGGSLEQHSGVFQPGEEQGAA